MEQELAYSFHLGSDKNKSKVAKKTAKGNVSGTTSLSNNAIQNANDLSRVNKHNLRDYDNQRELITTIYGTENIVNDVKQLYLDEFEESRIEYNNKQTRNDRKIDNYIKDVTDVTNTVRSVNDLNLSIKEFEHATFEIEEENKSLKYQIELKDEDIKELKKDLSAKEKIIAKLREEKESLKSQLQKFKGFWHNLMSHFHKKTTYDNDQNYKIVSDDLYKNGIFDDNDNEIANNIYRKVTIPDENKNNKLKKKNDLNMN